VAIKKNEKFMKGIILAGGNGTRLYPATTSVSKQLLPVYDKPLIYYPLSILMLAGIREILIITKSKDQILFKNLLGNGEQYGCNFFYKTQDIPGGLAEAFLIGEDFIKKDKVALILGDNIFYGSGFGNLLRTINPNGSTILALESDNPENFGVIEIDGDKIISIEEKPKNPKSNYIIPGLYFFDNKCVEYAKKIKPSKRGEKEITAILNLYLELGNLNLIKVPRGVSWFDTGTPENLFEATEFIKVIQKNTNKYVACLEEIALLRGFIDKKKLLETSSKNQSSDYWKYLIKNYS
jgi:glucose-1-phosphate thymidylyltransferase